MRMRKRISDSAFTPLSREGKEMAATENSGKGTEKRENVGVLANVRII